MDVPNGASTFVFGGRRRVRPAPVDFLPPLGKNMTRRFNEPTISFLCGASLPGAGRMLTFRIDQAIPKPNDKGARERVVNQVECYLHSLHERTGFDYDMDYYAAPDRMDTYLRNNGIKVD